MEGRGRRHSYVPSSAAEIRRALVRCLAMTATAVAGIHWRWGCGGRALSVVTEWAKAAFFSPASAVWPAEHGL